MPRDETPESEAFDAHSTTFEVELTEYQYWILVNGLAQAECASYRHGMDRHGRMFHYVNKQLFGEYERAIGQM